MLIRRIAWTAVFSMLTLNAASGQDYPRKPIRILTAGSGGTADFVSRILAQAMAAPLGQQVIVENRGGILPQVAVAQAPPDGYTLLLHSGSTWLAPFLEGTPYDPVRDFQPITWVTSTPGLLVVHPSIGVKNIRQLIALAKARPGELNYGSAAAGSTNHLSVELLKAMAGIDVVGVMYKGTGQAINDLMGGQVQMMIASSAGITPHVKSGRLRALGVTSAKPSALYEGVPAIAESGVPGYESVQILAMLAPSKTPVAIISRMNREVVQAVEHREVKEKFLNAGVEPVGSTPDQLAATIKSEMTRMGKVIKEANIRVN